MNNQRNHHKTKQNRKTFHTNILIYIWMIPMIMITHCGRRAGSCVHDKPQATEGAGSWRCFVMMMLLSFTGFLPYTFRQLYRFDGKTGIAYSKIRLIRLHRMSNVESYLNECQTPLEYSYYSATELLLAYPLRHPHPRPNLQIIYIFTYHLCSHFGSF